MRERNIKEKAAYGSIVAPNVVVTAAALATVAADVVSAASVAAIAVVTGAPATVVVVVVGGGDVALDVAPNELNDDAVGIAIGTSIVARVAPSSNPRKNGATLKKYFSSSSSFLILESKASPAILCEGQTTQPVIAPFVS